MIMHHLLLEESGTKTISTKVIDRYEMLITTLFLILVLSSSKNPLSMHSLLNGTTLMKTDISKTEPLSKQNILKIQLNISLMGGAADHGIEPWPAIGN
jgi:hypothetical protein